MKKLFVSMMMAGALLLGSTAYAQTDATSGATAKAKTEKACNGEKACPNCPNGELKGSKKAYSPFDGIQLTNDQQQRLQVLRQGLGPVQLTPEMKAKIKENPSLTPEQKQQLKAEKKAKKAEAKKNYLNSVKEILTPDQYVVFLENVYLYGPETQVKGIQKPNGKKIGQAEKGRKGKKDHKGQKGKSK